MTDGRRFGVACREKVWQDRRAKDRSRLAALHAEAAATFASTSSSATVASPWALPRPLPADFVVAPGAGGSAAQHSHNLQSQRSQRLGSLGADTGGVKSQAALCSAEEWTRVVRSAATTAGRAEKNIKGYVSRATVMRQLAALGDSLPELLRCCAPKATQVRLFSGGALAAAGIPITTC